MKKLIILLGVVGVSLSAIFVRAVEAPPMVLVFLRMFFASLVLIPWSLWQNREEWAALTRRELLLSILAGTMIPCNDGFRPVSFLLETMEEKAHL